VPPGGPPPRKPGLWKQATSTTGGLVALIVAGCLAALLLVGLVAAAAVTARHVVASHNREQRIERQDEAFPPGLRKQVPAVPRDGNGKVAPKAHGQLGPLLRGALGLGQVQHGELTVQGANGTSSVMTVQRGTVTASSSTSLTVKSTDGFTGTYAIDASTRGPAKALATGNTVLVVAQKSGNKAVLIQMVQAG
jgi:hypothetical protein